MIALTFLITLSGTLLSFTAVLAQFIGKTPATMETLAAYQLGFLASAVLLGIILAFRLPGGRHNPFLGWRFFTGMPGWLMFILLLTIITALLGDLSVLIVRLTGQPITGLFHLPSACILIYCAIFRLVHLAWTQRQQARPDLN